MDRRKFFAKVGQGASALGVLVTSPAAFIACGPEEQPQSSLADEATVTLQDLRMEGWSTLGSGFLGQNGTLKATQIRDNVEITLPYVQDSHGHTFILTPEHFQQLRDGSRVSVITTEALGHRHEVRIDPRKVDANSAPITMPLNPTADGGEPETLEVYVALSDGDDPKLYATANDDQALEYCVSEQQGGCSAENGTWTALQRSGQTRSQAVQQSPARMAVGQGENQVYLNLRVKDRRELLQQFLLRRR